MAKAASSIALDGLSSVVINNSTSMSVCALQPANSSQASSANALAVVSMSTTADYTKSGASSRVVTVSSKGGVTITKTGTADHIALFSTTTNVLYLVTTCSSQALSSGGTVTFPAWTFSIEQPV